MRGCARKARQEQQNQIQLTGRAECDPLVYQPRFPAASVVSNAISKSLLWLESVHGCHDHRQMLDPTGVWLHVDFEMLHTSWLIWLSDRLQVPFSQRNIIEIHCRPTIIQKLSFVRENLNSYGEPQRVAVGVLLEGSCSTINHYSALCKVRNACEYFDDNASLS